MTMPDKIKLICSCPEYFHGTGKPTKKKTTCKQCRGIKLPFTPIGGTVRFLPAPFAIDPAIARNFATVRLPSTCGSTERRRPTILSGDYDPYNYLRQSRLMYANRLNDLENARYYKNSTSENNVMVTVNYLFPQKSFNSPSPIASSDYYIDRSFLQTTTDINPYELISSTLHNNEFSPSSNIYNFQRENVTSKSNVQNAYRDDVLDVQLQNGVNDKPTKANFSQPPPPPAVESLPISIKTAPHMITKKMNKIGGKPGREGSISSKPIQTSSASLRKINNTHDDIKKIIKESKFIRTDNSTLTKKHFKKVQFNTLPEFSGHRTRKSMFIADLNDESIQRPKCSEIDVKSENKIEILNSQIDSENGQRRNLVMRSMSDRRDKDSFEKLNFKDTTALRIKSQRTIPPQIFQKPKSLTYRRPTCPPPKLPDSYQNHLNAPQRPPRQQKRSTNKTRPTLRDDEFKASRIFGLLPVSTISQNEIKIRQCVSPASASLHNENDILSSTVQKTSITINGGECLSTVNVNDCLYHSSVLIKDSSHYNGINRSESFVESIVNKNNSSDQIFKDLPNSSPEEKSSEIYNTTTNCVSKNTEMQALISTNVNKTKTLICLDYAKNLNTEHSVINSAINNEPSINKSFTKLNIMSNHQGSDSKLFVDSLILKLLTNPYLSQLLYGLEIKTIANIIENSLARLPVNLKTKAMEESEMDELFLKNLRDIIRDERCRVDRTNSKLNSGQRALHAQRKPTDKHGNTSHDNSETIPIQEIYDMFIDSSLWKNNDSSLNNDHQYETICLNYDPIYEEINEKPPPLPISPPPLKNDSADNIYKPMFLGATKYDILSYLVDAKDRIIAPEESYTYKFLRNSGELRNISGNNGKNSISHESSRHINGYKSHADKNITNIERNDSGVGSETSKISRTKYQPGIIENNVVPPIHLCEDCDESIDVQISGVSDIYMLITCRNCTKKRAERREILWEFIETEKKYTRDLQIIIDEFYQPMLVAGLLTQEQLSAIFLNIEELLENSESFCTKITDAFDAANEQGDEELFTVDIGKIILQASSMLCAFETYCIQQAAASLLLANMEKDKELLRIFLRVSQMENAVLRRMNLNSFLMVPVQRVTKYPLLLSRLYKVTPTHVEGRERLKEAQEKIECHLNRMNREAKDISTKLWRRLSSNPLRSRESDIVNIKLRKMAMDCLDWSFEKVHFIVEGKLLITHPTDNNWRRGKTIKLTPVNALLITNELVADISSDHTFVKFPRYSPNKETAFLLIREKSGRYSIYREPFYLDRCVICTESDNVEYFEVHEISSKDSFIFKAEDDTRTKHWFTQLQCHAQGTGAWRKRRRGMGNVMINGMMIRT